ncbi:MAG TPA: tetratricopeptide repeat protein [Deltaproteobacteria bacterium]|nr:tetratricopeptide repeat protein [Deltaproteobacteria bacterium]
MNLKHLAWSSFLVIIACAVLSVIAVVYAVPLSDGDIWFHLAYGRYFLQNHTLIPDHTVFSWTPSDNSTIYCAWIPQTIFYLVFQAGDLTALHVLRFAVITVFLILALSRARIWERKAHIPLMSLVILAGALMSAGGLRIKAELFSFLFMAILVWTWVTVKEKPEKAWPLLYTFPVIMVLWVNSHGGFIFGMIFLCLVLAGETVNAILRSAETLDERVQKHLFLALLASLAALVVTPYGWSYPAQLIDQLFIHPEEFRTHMQTIMEYQSIFFPQASHLHFVDLLVASSIVLAALMIVHVRSGRTDWAIILVNAAFVILYMRYLRTTYFWAVIFVFSCAHLIATLPGDIPATWRRKPFRITVQGAVLVFLVFLSLRTLHDTWYMPAEGHNPLYVIPREEATYISTTFPNARIGNDYYTGSYLLWSLSPGNRVFIDARYFPYRSWYSEYDRFSFTSDRGEFDLFLKHYTCDLWCISHDNPLVDMFRASADWRLVHYGPSASIFLSRRVPYQRSGHTVAASFDDAGFYRKYDIARFAATMGDIEVAQGIVRTMNPGLFSLRQAHLVMNAGLNVGNVLLSRERFLDAARVYAEVLGKAERNLLIGTVVDRTEPQDRALLYGNLGQALLRAGRPGEALKALDEALELDPGQQEAEKYRNLAIAQLEKGKAAIAQFMKEIATDPGNLAALRSLAVLHVMLGDFDAGLDAAQKVLSREPENPDNHYNIACILARQGRRGEALQSLARAVDLGFAGVELLSTDPDLEGIRRTEAFRELEHKVRHKKETP